MRSFILNEAHIAVYMAHPGVTKMRENYKPLFFWKGMKADQMNEPDLGGHVAHVCDGPTKELGRILATSRIRLQQ